MNTDLKAAADTWITTKGEGMADQDLELARAWFQSRRNSHQVRAINAVLRTRLLERLNDSELPQAARKMWA